MLSTSIDGAKTAAPWTARSTSSSSRQGPQEARCASMRVRSAGPMVPCRTSGSISWISRSMQLLISQELLYRLNRVVIMHSCRAFRAVHYLGDLLVRQPLLHPQGKNFPLRRRQCIERAAYPFLHFLSDQCVERPVLTHAIAFLNRHALAISLFGPPSIEHQVSLDREKPGSK